MPSEEMDFLVGKDVAIEVKASRRVTNRDFNGLKALAEEKLWQRYICVSHDPLDRQQGQVACLHWQSFLNDLWSDRLFFLS